MLHLTRKLGVEEWLPSTSEVTTLWCYTNLFIIIIIIIVSAVMSMYTGAKTVVRTVYGNSKGFDVKVGMHQGSGLSPLLFVIVIVVV